MSKYANYKVTYVGDYYSLTHFVEIDLSEPEWENMSEEELEEASIEIGKKNIKYHYGWDLDTEGAVWDVTVEVDYSPER